MALLLINHNNCTIANCKDLHILSSVYIPDNMNAAMRKERGIRPLIEMLAARPWPIYATSSPIS